jgi:hypothetical protein
MNRASYMRCLYWHRQSVFSLLQKIPHTAPRSIKTTTCRDSIQGTTMSVDAQNSSRL